MFIFDTTSQEDFIKLMLGSIVLHKDYLFLCEIQKWESVVTSVVVRVNLLGRQVD